ncbi:MAG: molybdopterin molybdotransferase MoeA [Propionibacteriaceae bacterium]|jgi:molybdopterin molybdotransferase|nr:molybdopterin molybdotransferase MoeA [Propionibacteriaceae bacterium]
MAPSGTPARPRLTVDQYRERVLAAAVFGAWPASETVATEAALGRVLAAEARAGIPIPRWPNAAMDGFGIAYRDGAPLVEHAVVADIPAGRLTPQTVGPGQAARIMTGAPTPPGVDTVVPLEDCLADGRTVRFVGPIRAGQHVRLAGEDVEPGARVVAAGTLLGARHLAAIAAVGVDRVTVARRPRVGLVTTGDELTAPGDELGPASIYDSNGPYLAGAVAEAGGRVTSRSRAGDTARSLTRALDEAAAGADLVLVTGGVSVGDRDIVRELLVGAGGQAVTVAMQPGKPQASAQWAGVPVLAFPGNPVGAAVSFACFARPVLAAMLARAPQPPSWAVVGTGWPSPSGRRQFMPVATRPRDDGRWLARPASPGGSGSHLVASLAGADAWAVIDEAVTLVRAGDVVPLVALA